MPPTATGGAGAPGHPLHLAVVLLHLAGPTQHPVPRRRHPASRSTRLLRQPGRPQTIHRLPRCRRRGLRQRVLHHFLDESRRHIDADLALPVVARNRDLRFRFRRTREQADRAAASRRLRQGGFSANGLLAESNGFAQKYDILAALLSLRSPIPRNLPRTKRADEIHTRALRWLDSLPQTPAPPVFLYLHSMEPHTPCEPPADILDRIFRDRPRPDLAELSQDRRRARVL